MHTDERKDEREKNKPNGHSIVGTIDPNRKLPRLIHTIRHKIKQERDWRHGQREPNEFPYLDFVFQNGCCHSAFSRPKEIDYFFYQRIHVSAFYLQCVPAPVPAKSEPITGRWLIGAVQLGA